MKFIHTADVHLGMRPEAGTVWETKRTEEIFQTFNKMINCCNQENVDLLLIAGDLFHKQPLIRELKEINYLFQKLTATKVVLIAGNHDYIGVRSNYLEFPFAENVFFLSSETMDSIYFEDINTEVYGFSYHSRDILEPRFQNAVPGVEERINILLGHGGDERDVPFDKKQLDCAGFDYVALGHIHKPELLTSRMAFAGSPEPLDKNELGEHGYFLGTLKKNEPDTFGEYSSEIDLKFIPCSARCYRKLEVMVSIEETNGSLCERIAAEIETCGVQDLYRIVLEGIREPAVQFDSDQLYSLGMIVEVVDHTVPDYDFEQIKQKNAGNIIGLYIERIQETSVEEKVRKKALYYGLDALLREE